MLSNSIKDTSVPMPVGPAQSIPSTTDDEIALELLIQSRRELLFKELDVEAPRNHVPADDFSS